jgi:uncharacterized metal-binding protein
MPIERERLAEVEKSYLENEELQKLARESARTEAAGYCRSTRIQEIMGFAWATTAFSLCIRMCRQPFLSSRIAFSGTIL